MYVDQKMQSAARGAVHEYLIENNKQAYGEAAQSAQSAEKDEMTLPSLEV